MGISSSLNAGVMGLNVNATKLAAISDNIANSETSGYKRADVNFSSMVLSEQRDTYSAGGVRATAFRDVTANGSLISTGSSTDIAINGRGMLPVTTTTAALAGDPSPPLMLVSTASFRPDSQGYLSTVNGLNLMGWPASPDGSITVPGRDSAAGLEPVRISNNQFAADPTTNIDIAANLPASSTTAGASGAPFSLPTEYFDNMGRSTTLTMTFTPTVPATGASNAWRLSIADSATGAAPVAEFDMAFDGSRAGGGSIMSVTPVSGGTYDSATGDLAIGVAGGPLTINIGAVGDTQGLTQLSAEFTPVSISKDGAGVGNLTSVEIDRNGFLEAIYDSGQRRRIYQIPIADVPNPNGLTAVDNQAFTVSRQSGGVYFWDAGSGPVGTTEGFSLEESNTDIANELTQLIQTQRAYSSNAKIIQTVDEMLQETTNLKR